MYHVPFVSLFQISENKMNVENEFKNIDIFDISKIKMSHIHLFQPFLFNVVFPFMHLVMT